MSDAPDLLAALVRSVEMARKERLETTMTPVDRLTRAADTLDRLADAATPGPWKATKDGLTHPVGSDVAPYVASECCGYQGACKDEDARLIALTSDPVTVRLIAAWLRDAAYDAALNGRGNVRPALALADHINERSTP